MEIVKDKQVNDEMWQYTDHLEKWTQKYMEC